MHNFRKLKPSAGTLPSTPESLAELAQTLVSQRDARAIIAMSSGIALSITPAFNDIRDLPSDDAADRGGDAGRRTADTAARMAIEPRNLMAQSLYDVLSSPVSEDDYAKQARRTELRIFVQELADAITQYHIKKRAPGT